jgi:hypothetical protein
MPERIKENSLPLNQLAKRALQSVKESPDSSDLYLLQLVWWALDKGKLSLDGPLSQQSTMREFLEAFPGWKPEIVMQVFLENSLQEPVEIYPPGPVNPVKLAEAALEQLHSRLTAAVPGYPIASQRD